jgi:hypothetical protein
MSDVLLHRAGSSRRFRFVDDECIGCVCFEPVLVAERTDDRRTDMKIEHATCRVRVRTGCPEKSEREYSSITEKHRRNSGWRDD